MKIEARVIKEADFNNEELYVLRTGGSKNASDDERDAAAELLSSKYGGDSGYMPGTWLEFALDEAKIPHEGMYDIEF